MVRNYPNVNLEREIHSVIGSKESKNLDDLPGVRTKALTNILYVTYNGLSTLFILFLYSRQDLNDRNDFGLQTSRNLYYDR